MDDAPPIPHNEDIPDAHGKTDPSLSSFLSRTSNFKKFLQHSNETMDRTVNIIYSLQEKVVHLREEISQAEIEFTKAQSKNLPIV